MNSLTMFAVVTLASWNYLGNVVTEEEDLGAVFEEIPNMVIYEHSLPLFYQTKYRINFTEFRIVKCADEKTDFCNFTNQFADVNEQLQVFLKNESENQNLEWLFDDRIKAETNRTKRNADWSAVNLLNIVPNAFGFITNRQHSEMSGDAMRKDEIFAKNLEAMFGELVTISKGTEEHSEKNQMNMDMLYQRWEEMRKLVNEHQKLEENHNMYNKLFLSVLKMFQNYFSIDRYRGILSHCKDHKIPISVVPIPRLRQHLQEKADVLRKVYDKEFVIPFDDANIVKYYSLPLTNCYYGKENLTVEISAPVRTTGYSWKLYEFTPLPFMAKGEICSFETQPLYLAFSDGRKPDSIKTITGTALKRCNVAEGMCYLDYFEKADGKSSLCAKQQFFHKISPSSGWNEDAYNVIRSACEFVCVKPSEDTPIVRKLRDRDYVVANIRKELDVYSPRPTRSFTLDEDKQKYGSMKIHLSCDEELRFRRDGNSSIFKILIPREFPCFHIDENLQPVASQILPLQWINLDETFFNVNKHRNYSTTNISFVSHKEIVNLSVPIKQKIHQQEFNEHVKDYQLKNNSNVFFYLALTWLIITTAMLVVIFASTRFVSRKVELTTEQMKALMTLFRISHKDVRKVAREIATKNTTISGKTSEKI